MVLVTAAAVWLSTRQSLSIKSRMLTLSNPISQEKNSTDKTSFPESLPNIPPKPTTLSTETLRTEILIPSLQPTIPDAPTKVLNQKINTGGEKQRTHIVQSGETLYDISRQYYGSADKWFKILEANRPLIKDANKITPGTKLIIPP